MVGKIFRELKPVRDIQKLIETGFNQLFLFSKDDKKNVGAAVV